jgi:hypothetical protein
MIRKLIKKWLGLYDLHDLRVGAHCGCCGHWIPEAIVEKDYSWDLCRDCEDNGHVSPDILPDRPWPKPPDDRPWPKPPDDRPWHKLKGYHTDLLKRNT